MTELTKHGVRNLNAPEWRSIRYVNSRGFIVPSHLADIVHDMLRKADPPAVIDHEWSSFFAASGARAASSALGYHDQIVAHAYVDAGGMCTTNRPRERFELPGLRIEIPSEDLSFFHRQLRGQVPHRHGERTFYLMFGWLDRCFVFTERMRERFLAMLEARMPDAEVRCRVFYANRKTAQEVLREQNEKRGAPPDLPYGDDRAKQYRPRERGEA